MRSLTIFPTLARTATPAAVDTPVQYKGANIIMDMTAVTATGTVTVKIEGKDAASGKYYTILESAALSAVATTILKIYPGVLAAANLAISEALPKTIKVTATHGNAVSMTYSVGLTFLL